MRKIDLMELKKAVQWIEANTKELKVTVEVDNDDLVLKTFDRNEQSVSIRLYSNNTLPKITKTEVLK